MSTAVACPRHVFPLETRSFRADKAVPSGAALLASVASIRERWRRSEKTTLLRIGWILGYRAGTMRKPATKGKLSKSSILDGKRTLLTRNHMNHNPIACLRPLLSFRSQHSRLVPLRMWFRWLTRRNHLLHNPVSELELPKLGQGSVAANGGSLPQNVSFDMVLHLLKAELQKQGDLVQQIRNDLQS